MSTRRPPDRSGRLPTPFTNFAPARTSATSSGALTLLHLPSAASISLKHIARPAALDPGPFVTFLRRARPRRSTRSGSRSEGGSSALPGARRTRVAPPDRRELGDGLRPRREVGAAPVQAASAWVRSSASQISREAPAGRGLHRGRQGIEHVGRLVDPVPLVGGGGEHIADRRPESERPVAGGEHRRARHARFRPRSSSAQLSVLPVAVGDGAEPFGPVGADPRRNHVHRISGRDTRFMMEAIEVESLGGHVVSRRVNSVSPPVHKGWPTQTRQGWTPSTGHRTIFRSSIQARSRNKRVKGPREKVS